MPKSNPFAQFSAGSKAAASSKGGGWLDTKKRGRDDERIEQDKQQALDARKKKNQRGQATKKTASSGSTSRSSRQAKSSKTKSKKSYDDSGDDSDENDSFIASDESELEVVESEDEEDFVVESDDDEEDVDLPDDNDDDGMSDGIVESDSSPEKVAKPRIVIRQSRVARAPIRGKVRASAKKVIDLDSSDEEASDGEDDIFEITQNSKPSKPEKGKAIGQSRVARAPIRGKARAKAKEVIDLDSSEDEDDTVQLGQKMKPSKPANAKNKQIMGHDLSELFSGDEDIGSVEPKPVARAKPQASSTKSRFFQQKEKRNDFEVASPTLVHKKNMAKKRSIFSDSDDDEFPSSKKARPKNSFVDDDDDEADAGLSDTDDEGLNEALALSKALALSQKEEEEKQKDATEKFSSKSNIIYKEDPKTDDDEDNDDEEGGGVEMDDYVDEKELEASSVLDAANNLSARIVSTMVKWFENGSGSTNTGLIVDGAIALSCVKRQDETNLLAEEKKEDTTAFQSKDDKWITQAEMERVCPKITLKDYQLIGVNWMSLLHRSTFQMQGDSDSGKKKKRKGRHGRNVNGVLADEMGLGKTAQTIAFLAWLKYRKTGLPETQNSDVVDVDDEDAASNGEESHKPHIIIVPASVLDNWLREFERFCPTMNIVKYHGSQAARQEIKDDLRSYLPKKKGPSKFSKFQKKLDVVITTFSYFSTEKSDDRGFLRKFDWNYMVVDEAHCLKNPKGKAYRNLDAFNTDRRLLLTGTPVQNSPKELMSLLCFLMPLFSREASSFDEDDNNDGGARMLEYFVRLEAVGKAKNNEVSQEKAYRKLKQLLAPFVLRRCKSEVLSRVLLPKNRQVEWVPFDENVRRTYDSILATHLQSKLDSSASSSNHVFTSLRKAANHALLLRTRHTSPEVIEHLSNKLYSFGYFGRDATCTHSLVKKELTKFSDYDIHCAAAALIDENSHRSSDLDRYLLQENDLYCSPKFTRLKVLLPKLVKDGHRMLIFSQWTRCLDLLGCLMDAMGFTYLRLDGQTDIQTRQQLIDQFTNDTSIPVFLLSTRAGGMGINLTAADTCILHDLDFNPFNDIQAEDRVHRIGQHKLVTVIKMVTEDTVDADIYKMQERKAEMNAAILETKTSGAKQKKEESKEMNSMLKNAVTRYQMS